MKFILSLCFLFTSLPVVLAIGRDIISPPVSEQGIEYFVLLSDTEGGSSNVRCAGVLVYEDIVLTTAQCAELWEDGQVEYARVGYATDSTNNVGTTTISKVIKHPSWSRNHRIRRGDIAIFVLNESFDDEFYASYLEISYAVIEDGQPWIVLGAGATSEGGDFASELQGDELYTVYDNECRAAYAEAELENTFTQDSHICMGVDIVAAGACSTGDLGAPVLKSVDGFIFIAGLASFGAPGCGKFDPPFLYTRVSSYSGWITDTICDNTKKPGPTCPTPAPTQQATLAPVMPKTLDYIDFFSIITDTEEGSSSSRCGAVLVHEDIIITAAGCTREDDIVRVGYSTDYDSMEIRKPVDIINHPDFFVNQDFRFVENLPNDISVVKLDAPVTGITPVRINSVSAVPGDNSAEVYFAHAGTVRDVEDPFKMGTFVNGAEAGVGKYNYAQSGTTTTQNFRFCRQSYIDLPGFQAKLNEGLQFCVNPSGISPCDADAWGSPLWVDDGKGPILVGIASQGQCKADGMPFVYTRVAKYYSFINEVICFLSSNPPSSCRRLRRTSEGKKKLGLDAFRNHMFDKLRRPRTRGF